MRSWFGPSMRYLGSKWSTDESRLSSPSWNSFISTFLPAKEFKTSLRFYESIGFEAYRLGDTLAELSLGVHAFLLQDHYVKEWAGNTVMHVLVNDVYAWWQHINSLDLANHFGVSSPAPPRAEPRGLTFVYVFDPTGVLWHFAEVTK